LGDKTKLKKLKMFKKGLTGGSYLCSKEFANAKPKERKEKTIICVGSKHG
tara:strand:+ start:479 stop:628 length:150 start_codon:yes stop_codon:yes gene_type:complete